MAAHVLYYCVQTGGWTFSSVSWLDSVAKHEFTSFCYLSFVFLLDSFCPPFSFWIHWCIMGTKMCFIGMEPAFFQNSLENPHSAQKEEQPGLSQLKLFMTADWTELNWRLMRLCLLKIVQAKREAWLWQMSIELKAEQIWRSWTLLFPAVCCIVPAPSQVFNHCRWLRLSCNKLVHVGI